MWRWRWPGHVPSSQPSTGTRAPAGCGSRLVFGQSQTLNKRALVSATGTWARPWLWLAVSSWQLSPQNNPHSLAFLLCHPHPTALHPISVHCHGHPPVELSREMDKAVEHCLQRVAAHKIDRSCLLFSLYAPLSPSILPASPLSASPQPL